MRERRKTKRKSYSRKELKSILMSRLNTLQDDVDKVPENVRIYMTEIKRTNSDRYRALMDIYATENVHVKVADYTGIPKKPSDMTAEMLEFSSGFDKYIDSLEKEYLAARIRRSEAIRLMTLVMSLQQPYSRLLYLRFYRKLSPDDASNAMHLARSTMFRKQSTAMGLLIDSYAKKYDLILKSEK